MPALSWTLITPVMDGPEYRGGLGVFVADMEQVFREVCKTLE